MNVYVVDYGYHKGIIEELSELLDTVGTPSVADAIVVVGGDGTMLRAIADYKSFNVPFFGINRGTRGFLLNDVPDISRVNDSLKNVKTELLWQLTGCVTFEDGTKTEFDAFNDIWIERSLGQSLKVNLWINDFENPSPLMSGDGLLFSTPQGSTGYNRSASGKVIPLDREIIQVTPLHLTIDKVKMTSMIFAFDYGFKVTMHERDKRPARVFFDQSMIESDSPIVELSVKRSNMRVGLQMISCNNFLEKTLDWQLHR